MFDVLLILFILLREYQTKQMADLVKRGREKKQSAEGDCLSVPSSFFGALVINMRDDQLSLGKNRGIRDRGELSVE